MPRRRADRKFPDSVTPLLGGKRYACVYMAQGRTYIAAQISIYEKLRTRAERHQAQCAVGALPEDMKIRLRAAIAAKIAYCDGMVASLRGDSQDWPQP